jgi:eukaryotic-like serine/threonine-protein kinase
MPITLTVIAGPLEGTAFTFAEHDTFLVGRSRHAHFRLKDKFLSAIHFMMEWQPPRCRLIDLGSHNGTYVNGSKTSASELKSGDVIRAGHTTLRLDVAETL